MKDGDMVVSLAEIGKERLRMMKGIVGC